MTQFEFISVAASIVLSFSVVCAVVVAPEGFAFEEMTAWLKERGLML